jgi:HK97 family phage prohead protease
MTIQMFRARFNGSLQRAAGEDKTSRSFDFVCSTPDVDSSGRIVVQDWDLARFKKNPVVLWNHGMGASFWGDSDDTDLTLPIGYASNVRVEDDKLKATLTIVDEKANPIAEKVYQGLLQGSLRCTSVGWWPRDVKYEKHDGEDVAVMRGNQLLEISVVTIPANAEATKEAASFAAQLKQLRKNDDDMKNIAKRLGLLETASEEEVLAKIDELTARVDDCEMRLADLEGGGSASDDSTDESATDESAAAADATARLERIRDAAEKAGRKGFAARIAALFQAEKTLLLHVAADAERIESERLAEIDRLCARAIEEGKMTPSSKVHALAALGDKPSIEQVKRMIAGLLVARNMVDPKAKRSSAGAQDKTFEQYSFSERASLMQENRPLYDELKADFERRRGGR